MSIRKEQVLLILVVLLAAYCAPDYFTVNQMRSRWNPLTKAYESQVFDPTPLIESAPEALVRHDFMTEPSETRPLSPRELVFPPRSAMSVAGLPLDPGPDFSHSWLLRQDGEQVVGVTIERGNVAEGNAGDNAGDGDGNEPVIGTMSEERAAKLYDRIYIAGLSKPNFGRIEPQDGVDLFALEESSDFGDVTLRMRLFSRSKKQLGNIGTFGGGAQAISKIVLAGTIRNEVERHLRRVPQNVSYQSERVVLITWLLKQARAEAWIYDEALKQADVYLQMSGDNLEGRQVMQRVLQARGDISGQMELLKTIEGDDVAQAFKLRGIGVIKAQLGLMVEAEEDLAEAARLTPSDAESHATLADFYRLQGRSRDAMVAARRARQTIGSVQDEALRQQILRTIQGCRLAVGDLADAVNVGSELSYMRGCVQYASGDMTAALAAFQQVTASRDAGAAQLGQAACSLSMGNWQEAHDMFVQVADREPLLRHRAMTGLALLFSRLSQFDAALTHVDRALEAAPNDTYALYLRGRTLRLMGQFGAAQEALSQTLRQRDDFVHAIAEMSLVQVGMALNATGTDQAAALIAARRYIDRAVALAPDPELELFELQGLRAFGAADARGARKAYEQARDLASTDVEKGYAKGALAVVAYSRGRVDDAMTALERVERDLGRDSVMGKWAGATLQDIQNHAEKEALGDTFDRETPGEIWSGDADGPLRAQIRDGSLVFSNKFTTRGNGEVLIERVNAVKNAKNFLACSATVQIGGRHVVAESFVGLGIEIRRARQGIDFSARVGLRDGKPFVMLVDGRDDKKENEVSAWPSVDLLRQGEPQELELRVMPRVGESNRQLLLNVYFNDALVITHELKQLTTSTQTELKTILFATGDKGAMVDVAFDDYELERRKGKR